MIDTIKNIDWEHFHFLRPDFLWFFAPLALILIISFISFKEEVKWKNVIAPHLRPYVIKKGSESFKKWMQVLLVLVMSIGTLGLAGPTWKMSDIPDKKLETPVVIALDLSQSMMATDIQPNRLERAKFKVQDFLAENPRARIALVGYAGSAHTIIPLTRDYKIINTHIEGLSPKMMPYQGSNLKAALKVIDTITNITTATAKLILISDDFSNESFNLISRYASNNDVIVEIIPMNTTGGAEIPAAYGSSKMKDSKGNIVRSALNSEVLNKLNSIENINVNTLTLDNSDMEALAERISTSLEFNEENDEVQSEWQDEGYWLVFPLAFFVLLWFRKGWVIYSLVFVITLSSCNKEVKNNSSESKKEITFNDLWYTKDYQAQKLEDEGNFREAAETYETPIRKGVAYYKDGDYEMAIEEFEKDSTAMGAYNLGISYYKNGDYAAAALAFGKAIEMDPDNEEARQKQQLAQNVLAGESEANIEDAQEAIKEQPTAENKENDSSEDLSGGGQEATKEDMEKERLEENIDTDISKGEELDEVPEDFEMTQQDASQKILMRKVDDDPALFLKRKFLYEVKKNGIKPQKNTEKW